MCRFAGEVIRDVGDRRREPRRCVAHGGGQAAVTATRHPHLPGNYRGMMMMKNSWSFGVVSGGALTPAELTLLKKNSNANTK